MRTLSIVPLAHHCGSSGISCLVRIIISARLSTSSSRVSIVPSLSHLGPKLPKKHKESQNCCTKLFLLCYFALQSGKCFSSFRVCKFSFLQRLKYLNNSICGFYNQSCTLNAGNSYSCVHFYQMSKSLLLPLYGLVGTSCGATLRFCRGVNRGPC